MAEAVPIAVSGCYGCFAQRGSARAAAARASSRSASSRRRSTPLEELLDLDARRHRSRLSSCRYSPTFGRQRARRLAAPVEAATRRGCATWCAGDVAEHRGPVPPRSRAAACGEQSRKLLRHLRIALDPDTRRRAARSFGAGPASASSASGVPRQAGIGRRPACLAGELQSRRRRRRGDAAPAACPPASATAMRPSSCGAQRRARGATAATLRFSTALERG